MKCPLCEREKPHKHGKTSKGAQRYFCPKCRQTFTETFDTLYYRCQVSEEEVRIVLQAHAEGSSWGKGSEAASKCHASAETFKQQAVQLKKP